MGALVLTTHKISDIKILLSVFYYVLNVVFTHKLMDVLPPLSSFFPQSSTDPVRVWSSCLVKCSEVLESCVGVFSEVKEQTVLEEIAQSEEGRNKLKGMDSCLANPSPKKF